MERTLRTSKKARVRPIVEGWRFRPPRGLGDGEIWVPELRVDDLASREGASRDEVPGEIVEGVEANRGKST